MTDSPLRKLAALAIADADPGVIALGERLAAWVTAEPADTMLKLSLAMGLRPDVPRTPRDPHREGFTERPLVWPSPSRRK